MSNIYLFDVAKLLRYKPAHSPAEYINL